MNTPIKLLHPSDRSVAVVKPYLLAAPTYRGYLRAPWDCPHLEREVCTCDRRPLLPDQGQEEEAVRDLQERIARFAAAGLIVPSSPSGPGDQAARIAELEAEVARLTALLNPPPDAPVTEPQPKRGSTKAK